jgi:uncharacterized protein YecE (DUF72 family)
MIRIGTAGFHYKDWEGKVYPSPKPKGFDPLAYLAGFFPTIEMNVTFYRVPTAENVAKWMQSAAHNPDFRFTFKLYRGLTHDTEDEMLLPFLDAMKPCRDAGKLGAILLQFPFFFKNTGESRARVAALATRLEGWPCAIEIRDRSWLHPAALDFLRERRLSLCDIDICQTATSIPAGSWTTGPLGYVRFHGQNRDAWFDPKATVAQKYDYLYSMEELTPWSVRVREIADTTEATYVIMNNHFAGKAVANAFHLLRLLGMPAPAAPPNLPA